MSKSLDEKLAQARLNDLIAHTRFIREKTRGLKLLNDVRERNQQADAQEEVVSECPRCGAHLPTDEITCAECDWPARERGSR